MRLSCAPIARFALLRRARVSAPQHPCIDPDRQSNQPTAIKCANTPVASGSSRPRRPAHSPRVERSPAIFSLAYSGKRHGTRTREPSLLERWLHGSRKTLVAKAEGDHLAVGETIALGQDLFGSAASVITRRTPMVAGRNKQIA